MKIEKMKTFKNANFNGMIEKKMLQGWLRLSMNDSHMRK
jgi:hypothetical protein